VKYLIDFASNTKVIVRRALNNSPRTVEIGDIIGIGTAKSVEVYNAANPADLNANLARVKFNTEANNIDEDYRLVRPNGSYPIIAKIKNITFMGVGAEFDLHITISW
jgi:hypothetical protein